MLYFVRMKKVTVDHLIISNQPKRLFASYKLPLPVIADMINEASTEIRDIKKSFLGTNQNHVIEKGELPFSHSFFAARRHFYNKNAYVLRIQYKFVKVANSKSKFSVDISHAEIINEQDYQPALLL
jgi:hypothetical protein